MDGTLGGLELGDVGVTGALPDEVETVGPSEALHIASGCRTSGSYGSGRV